MYFMHLFVLLAGVFLQPLRINPQELRGSVHCGFRGVYISASIRKGRIDQKRIVDVRIADGIKR